MFHSAKVTEKRCLEEFCKLGQAISWSIKNRLPQRHGGRRAPMFF